MKTQQTYSTVIKDLLISCTSAELTAYRNRFISDPGIRARISDVLTFEVVAYEQAFGIDPHDVFGKIRDLENGTISGVKPASQFKHLPLKGLWHQHFFSAHFIIRNIQLGLGKSGVPKLVREVFSKGSETISQEMINEISHRMVHDPLNARFEKNRITGEWIIFIVHGQSRYYLCLSTHKADAQSQYDKIVRACISDFPELPVWIEEARRNI